MPTLKIQNKTLHYLDTGGNGDPVIFGHSYLWDSTAWQPQFDYLSKHFRCIAPDLWGHGKSDNLDTDSYSIKQLSDDYWQFIQALELEQFSLVGLSVGGMWGVQLALDHPENLRSLVIMDSFVGEEPATSQQQYLAMLEMVQQCQAMPEALIQQIYPLFFSPTTIAIDKNPLVDNFKQRLASVQGKQALSTVTMGKAIFTRPSLLQSLAQISCPTLILVGKDDIPRPVAESEIMLEQLPHAHLESIPDAGHISNLEQTESVNTLLSEFLLAKM